MTDTKTKKTKAPTSRISIKWIKNISYVYTWRYIKKAERYHKQNRFEWVYIGPLVGKGREFIRAFSREDEQKAREDILERCKLGQYKIRRNEVTSLPSYYQRRKEIEGIGNRDRERAIKLSEKLQTDIEKEAKEFVDTMFQQFTSESFYEYLSSGGNLTDLYESTKKALL